MLNNLKKYINIKLVNFSNNYFDNIKMKAKMPLKTVYNKNYDYLNIIYKIYNSNRLIFFKDLNINDKIKINFYKELNNIENIIEEEENKFYEKYVSSDCNLFKENILFNYRVYKLFHESFDLNLVRSETYLIDYFYKLKKSLLISDYDKIEANTIIKLMTLIDYYFKEKKNKKLEFFMDSFNFLIEKNIVKFHKINNNNITYFSYVISNNFTKIINHENKEIIFNFLWKDITNRLETLSINHFSQIVYSLGKMSFFDVKIIKFIEIKIKYYTDYYKKIIIKDSNNKLVDLNLHFLINLIYYYETNNIKQNNLSIFFINFLDDITISNNIINLLKLNTLKKLFSLFNLFLKKKYIDVKLVNVISRFNNILIKLNNNILMHHYFYIIKYIEIFKDNIIIQNQDFIKNYEENILKFYNKYKNLININRIKNSKENMSIFHKIIKIYLNKLNVKFNEEHLLEIIYVDIFIPKYNLAIELDGPIHFTNNNIENTNTWMRNEIIKKLNINLIVIKLEDYFNINKLNKELKKFIN